MSHKLTSRLCSRCGNRKPIAEFSLGYKTCKLCCVERTKYYREVPIVSPEQALNNIDLPYFMKFWSKTCVYCNQKYQGGGIDRIDSAIGYIDGNCVPACTVCNHMKMAMTKVDFLKQCKLISDVENSNHKELIPYTFIA